jgi:hypothetical protein
MDFDLKDILPYLQDAAQSVGAVVTSPWFYFQLGLIVSGQASPTAREPACAPAST